MNCADPQSPLADKSDPLPRRCGACGYPLGFPPQGNCPECGAAYSADYIVLAGWGSKGRETLANAHPRRLIAVMLVAGGFFLLNGLLQLVFRHYVGGLANWCIFLVLVSAFLWRQRRLLSQFDLPSFVHLSRRGAGQRDGPGRVMLVPWSRAGRPTLVSIGGDKYRLEVPERIVGSWTMPRPRVAIELQCSLQQAEHLRALLISLRSGDS
jgi:hypothetical protein